MSSSNEELLKFDFLIGNPPYQDDTIGESTQNPAIYDKFMDRAYAIADVACLITPARFLTNAGTTPKAWNRQMLADPHLKVAYYAENSDELFPGTDIKGGVAVTYRDANRKLGPIGQFTPHDELGDILAKVEATHPKSLMSIVSSRGSYKYGQAIFAEQPGLMASLSDTGRSYLGTNVFTTLAPLFYENVPNDGHRYAKLLGVEGRNRVTKYIRQDYLATPVDFDKYKVILPNANNSGAFGETLSSPMVGEPYLGYVETFIGVGAFDTEQEANACLKYLKSKFARAMLSVLKTTQHNPAPKWRYVPLQDFTANSDIDWTKSIHEIDQQLYKKYGLNKTEIDFIENNVKAMA